MKIKVRSNEFKKALASVRPIASKPIFGTGVVGLFASGKTLHIKAFSEICIDVHIECSGIADDMFVAISPACIGAILLYCDDYETEIEFLDGMVVIKSGKFNTLLDHSNEDMSPIGVDFNEAEWLELPDQTRELVKASLTGCEQNARADVLYVSDYLFCTNGFKSSTYRPDWDFTGYVPIPKSAIDAVIRIADADADAGILMSYTRRLITLRAGDTYITTTYPDHWDKPIFEEFYGKEDGLVRLSGGMGSVSEMLTRELEVCVMQREAGSPILLWTDGREDGLHFLSEKSAIGWNRGVVWSDLTDFQVRCDAALLNDVIPPKGGQMWSMGLVETQHKIDDANEKEIQPDGKILIEVESGVRHIVMPLNSTPKEFEELRSK